MEKRINAGYEIINSMQLCNQFGTEMEVVMGYKEKAPQPFVTWQYYPGKDSYEWGHYFSSKESAVKDFFERGMNEMGLDMRREYQKENAVADIESALNWHFGEDETQGLLKDEKFMEKAIRKYDNFDHSYEMEMLQDGVHELYNELVGQKEIFNFKLMDDYNERIVHVELNDGRAFEGTMKFNPKSSVSSFWLEIPAEHENEAPGYEIINAKDVKELRLEAVKEVDMDSALQKEESEDYDITHVDGVGELIKYELPISSMKASYEISKDTDYPGVYQYYDEIGGWSVTGTKEDIIGEMKRVQCPGWEIEGFEKHLGVLLERYPDKEPVSVEGKKPTIDRLIESANEKVVSDDNCEKGVRKEMERVQQNTLFKR